MYRLADGILEQDCCGIHDKVWASKLLADLDRARGSATRTAERDDERSVAVLCVPARALFVACATELYERVARGDHTVLSQPALGAPPAARHAETQCRIEGATIHTGLTA